MSTDTRGCMRVYCFRAMRASTCSRTPFSHSSQKTDATHVSRDGQSPLSPGRPAIISSRYQTEHREVGGMEVYRTHASHQLDLGATRDAPSTSPRT